MIKIRRSSMEYKLLNNENPIKDSLTSKYIRIFLVVSGYWIVSISTVFINKTLFSNIHLDAPLFITWFQCLTSIVICLVVKYLSVIFPSSFTFPRTEAFEVDTIKKVLPVSILFTAMISTNNLCLKYVSVAFYYIGRSLTTIFNVVFTYMLLGQTTSLKCIGMCFLIILGFLMGVDQESLSGSLSYAGVFFGIVGSLSLSLFSIYTKKVLPSLNNEVWLLSYYNNIYSSFLFIPLIVFSNEVIEVVNYAQIAQIYFWTLMVIGGIFGFAIGFFTALQIKVTSPLTHNISGTAKACAQTVLATYWYQESKSLLWWFSNGIVLFGSASYARLKQLDMEKQYNVTRQSAEEKC